MPDPLPASNTADPQVQRSRLLARCSELLDEANRTRVKASQAASRFTRPDTWDSVAALALVSIAHSLEASLALELAKVTT